MVRRRIPLRSKRPCSRPSRDGNRQHSGFETFPGSSKRGVFERPVGWSDCSPTSLQGRRCGSCPGSNALKAAWTPLWPMGLVAGDGYEVIEAARSAPGTMPAIGSSAAGLSGSSPEQRVGVAVDVGAVAVVALDVRVNPWGTKQVVGVLRGHGERDDERRAVAAVPAGWHGCLVRRVCFRVPAHLLGAVCVKKIWTTAPGPRDPSDWPGAARLLWFDLVVVLTDCARWCYLYSVMVSV